MTNQPIKTHLDKFQEKIRKEFLSAWAIPTEKEYTVDCCGAEETAVSFYAIVLAPMGW